MNNIKIIGRKKSCQIKVINYKLATAIKIVDVGLINFNLDWEIERNCQNKNSIAFSTHFY